jgi:HK97 family phage major capsid protein
LVPVTPCVTGTVEYLQENIPVGSGSFGFASEGSQKAQLDYDFTIVTEKLEYLAGYCKASRQILTDLPQLTQFISRSLYEDYNRQLDIETYRTIVSSTPMIGSSSETLAASKLLDYVSQVLAGGRIVTAVAVSPASWTRILKTMPTNAGFSYPGGIQVQPSGEISIFGLPLYVLNSLDSGTIVAGDFQGSITFFQTDGMFRVSSTETNADDYVKNLISFRGESRIGIGVMRPKSFVVGTI